MKEKIWFDKKIFTSAILGALLSFLGAVIYYNFERHQVGEKIVTQIKWEIYENITDIFSATESYDEAETFKNIAKLKPESSIQDTKFYYLTRHDLRDDFFKARIGDFTLFENSVMKDVLEFYSLLHSVDENERQMEKIFDNKINLKAGIVSDIANDIAENTKRMRTMGAQVVGKIMYYYNNYDLNIRKKDSPEILSENVINDLYKEVAKYVDGVKTGQTINAYELAEKIHLLNSESFVCNSAYSDVCVLATTHYLILKTEKTNNNLQVYNGYIKK